MSDNNDKTLAQLYANKAKELLPSDPIGLCNRMADEQHRIWTMAADMIHTTKPTTTGNVCSECGGTLKQAGSCSVCTNCGSTTGCG